MASPPSNDGAVTVDVAIRRGQRQVNYPVMAFFVAPLSLIFLFPDLPDLAYLPILLFQFGGAWLWWSVTLPKWRVWALENVDDIHALLDRAIAEKLMWPPGHFFEKTEIKSSELRERERLVMERRLAELRQAVGDDP